MSTAYYRLKKHRKLQRSPDIEVSETLNIELENSDLPLEVGIVRNVLNETQHIRLPTRIEDNYDLSYLTDSSIDYLSRDLSRSPDYNPLDYKYSSSSSSSQNSSNSDSGDDILSSSAPSLRDKLQNFVVRFRSNMTIELIENLLEILRSENHYDLPKSATSLLQTKSNKTIQVMKSLKNTNGSYVYFGIEEGLKGIISDEYTENTIRLMFNIDGLPLYNSSSQQFWPNLGLIVHEKYDSKPFIVAVYSGDSKPKNVNDFIKDFVQEVSSLVKNGLNIRQTFFKIEIIGFSCDTPARAFIKKCKGHGGFYSCERCETRGKTINHKRVYPSINSKLRTKRSFIKQRQREHHLDGRSLLLDIPDFDPVNSVFLDSMHLLYLGIMKWILQQLLGAKMRVNRKCKLSQNKIKHFNSILKKFTRHISKEFQRKKLDLDSFAHWKATQFRFFLNYCGALVLRKILNKKMYHNFLLLVVACRILNDPELCVEKIIYARDLLRKFVELLPSFYGPDSQIMNSHNLIHIADDVKYNNMPLSAFSAFPFENFLGKIKRMIGGRNKPLAQLVRRVSEQKACPKMMMNNAIHKKKFLIINPDITHKRKNDLKSIILRGFELNTTQPNNIVKLDSDDIFSITRIQRKQNRILLHGYAYKTVTDAFKFPCRSTEVGIMKLGRLCNRKIIISIDNVLKKCVFFENGCNSYAVTLLHNL